MFQVKLSYLPVRSADSDKAEMVTQMLYGEVYEVLFKTEKWLYIRGLLDNYHGWIDHIQHLSSTKLNEIPNVEEEYAVTKTVTPLEEDNIVLSVGSLLPKESSLINKNPMSTKADILATAYAFLNTPYLWGGKTIWGCDCSGFVQSVFRSAQLFLPRDAYEQAQVGSTVNFISEAQALDLAFFDNAAGKITHVGIITKPEHILHASGFVKEERIDQEGIYNQKLGKYSHKLRIIKRVL
ncbi:MAG: C40 family peptidase [Luteibaculaceae bacterium]